MQEVLFHFFNVGRGESILIEIIANDTIYILVDSHEIKGINPAYDYLTKRGVKKIAAIVISHFHKDHVLGIEKFLHNFTIQKICIPPIFSRQSSTFSDLLNRYKQEIRKVIRSTKDHDIHSEMRSFIELIKFLFLNEDLMEEIEGPETLFRIPDIKESIAYVFLPLARQKGIVRKRIIEGSDFNLDNFPTLNDMSSAIIFKIFGNNVLLTGDSTINQWLEHEKRMKRNNINKLDVQFLKAAHHGSKANNNKDLFEYFFTSTPTNKNHLFISADGNSHPHDVIFDLIMSLDLKPYCTNLANQCSMDILKGILWNPTIPKEMIPFLINYKIISHNTACQGDITLQIDDKNFDVYHSTNYKCIYH